MILNFSIDQSEIVSALALCQSICSKKTSLEATSCVLFQLNASKELIIRSTDLEISIQSSLTPKDSSGEGILSVNGKRLFDIVKDLNGTINFSYDGKRLFIESESSSQIDLSLSTPDPLGFPPFPENIENLMDIDSDFLKKTLNKLIPLAPLNNANQAINGIFIQCLEKEVSFVATDGHSLARVVNFDLNPPAGESRWTLPKKSAIELKKALDAFSSNKRVFLGTCKGQIVFSGDNFNFFSRTINEAFPDYKAALEKSGFYKGAFKIQSITPALKRAGHLLSGKFMPTGFSFSKEKNLGLHLNNKEIGELKESISLSSFDSGSDMKISFYSPYVLSAVQAFEDSEEVNFFIKTKQHPMFLSKEGQDSSFTYLIMPIVQD